MSEIETGTVLLWIAGQLLTAASIWGGIRSDIRNMRERIARVELSTDKAHKRLDLHLESGRKLEREREG